jgi:hypothetical protein
MTASETLSRWGASETLKGLGPLVPREPRPYLHNMSAPPRATIAFRLVTQRAAAADELPATGLRWVCRIDVPAVFWPMPEGVGRDIAQMAGWQQTLEPQRRLLAQALAEEGGLERPDAGLAIRVDAMPAEAVLDALRDVALRADTAALGLPAFGLLRPARGTKARQSNDRMRPAVAVLARRRGGIFLSAADPLPLSSVTEALDLWTPEPEATLKEPQ